jgi:hypothetical protein
MLVTVKAQNAIKDNSKNWKQISLPEFSFSVPKAIKDLKSTGIHSQIWQSENENIFLSIELGDYVSPRLGAFKGKPTFQEKFIEVDGENAYLIFYQLEDPNEEYKYASEIYFSSQNKRRKLSLKIYSKAEDDRKIAEKIFFSIKFKIKKNQHQTPKLQNKLLLFTQ